MYHLGYPFAGLIAPTADRPCAFCAHAQPAVRMTHRIADREMHHVNAPRFICPTSATKFSAREAKTECMSASSSATRPVAGAPADFKPSQEIAGKIRDRRTTSDIAH